MRVERALPFVLLAVILAIGLAPLVEGCVNITNVVAPADSGAPADLRAKLQAACTALCECLTNPSVGGDFQTCVSGCTSMSTYSYYPTSYFGSNMPSAACLDCLAGYRCGTSTHGCDSLCL
jgi:hypothetical protein